MTPIIECVPNFSEGRRPEVVQAIVNAVGSVSGTAVLAHESDPDHNRAVVTFAGAPRPVAESAFRAIATAVERIDLSRHAGVHPRIGAADVVPFVPVEGSSLEECAALAVETGERVWKELRVPVYLYEAAARIPERKHLENLRRGGLAWLRDHIVAERRPDIGDPVLHPTAGAVILGARKLLVAFNINLTTDNLEIARSIARKIRASSGGFPSIKSLGLPLSSRGLAQVSINFTDFEVTGLFPVFQAVKREAEAHGVGIAGSELIGLIPRLALENAAAEFLKIEAYSPQRVLGASDRRKNGDSPG